MTKVKSQARSSNEKYCSSCPSKSKFIPKQKTCHSLTSYESPSFSNALQSRTPYDRQLLQYYNGKASKVDYDIAPLPGTIEPYVTNFIGMDAQEAKEIILNEYDGITQISILPKNANVTKDLRTDRVTLFVNDADIVQIVDAPGIPEIDTSQQSKNSVEHYRENMCLAPTCSTQLTTQMKNGQLWLTIDGPNGPYELPTWNSKSDYYALGTNDTIILTYTQGGQSIGLGISGNDLSYQLYIFATCSKWYLLNNRSYPNTFYGSYSNGTFVPDNLNADAKLTETGGSSDNPIQAMVLLANGCDNSYTYIYLQYYTTGNTTYICCTGGNIIEQTLTNKM